MAAAPLAPGTFTLFQNADLGAGAPSGYTSVVGEPSVGNNGAAVFQTGNWYAALSTDSGATFGFVNPFTTFPSVNGGFCCDQSVLYDRSRDLLFWLMLYLHDTNTNTLRLAIAKGGSALASGSWYYYDLTPQMVGLPAGRWFDYPQLTLSNNYLYVTANVFTISGNSWTNTVIMRLPLDTLSAHTALTVDYYVTSDHFNFTATQGATTRIYWGSQSLTSSQIRLYQWDEGSPTVSWTDVAISSYPLSTPSCPGPDGKDWCGRSDDRILGAWVANGNIGFMWNASQGSGYPYPHVRAVRMNESTKAVIDQPVLWSSNVAWMYPAVGVNARGHIAGPVFSGGGTSYLTLNVFIWDDLSHDPVTSGWETYGVVTSTNGPTLNKWGDYLASRPQSPYGNTWIGTGYSLQGGGANSNARPRFVWFGRERDNPVPTNTAPLGNIDRPGSGATVSGTVAVLGWAADRETPSGSLTLTLLIDGSPVTAPLTRYTRSDVCAVYPETSYPGACTSGFNFAWNTTSLSGSHAVAVRVTDSGGLSVMLGPRTVTVQN